jgi:hypothetical protein
MKLIPSTTSRRKSLRLCISASYQPLCKPMTLIRLSSEYLRQAPRTNPAYCCTAINVAAKLTAALVASHSPIIWNAGFGIRLLIDQIIGSCHWSILVLRTSGPALLTLPYHEPTRACAIDVEPDFSHTIDTVIQHHGPRRVNPSVSLVAFDKPHRAVWTQPIL